MLGLYNGISIRRQHRMQGERKMLQWPTDWLFIGLLFFLSFCVGILCNNARYRHCGKMSDCRFLSFVVGSLCNAHYKHCGNRSDCWLRGHDIATSKPFSFLSMALQFLWLQQRLLCQKRNWQPLKVHCPSSFQKMMTGMNIQLPTPSSLSSLASQIPIVGKLVPLSRLLCDIAERGIINISYYVLMWRRNLFIFKNPIILG